jgi:hypothetical protein
MTQLPLEADERLKQIYDRALSASLPCAWYTRGYGSTSLKLKLADGASGFIVDVKPEKAERFALAPFESIVVLDHTLRTGTCRIRQSLPAFEQGSDHVPHYGL